MDRKTPKEMAWWIDRPWHELRDTPVNRSTLPYEDARMLLTFWDQILPLTSCTGQEYFGRASVLPDQKGGFSLLVHAMQVGFPLSPTTCAIPEPVAAQIVGSSGDFLVRVHAMGQSVTANDIVDAFRYLSVSNRFRGYLVAMRSGMLVITMASHLVEGLRHSVECGNMNGAHTDTFESVWARMCLMLYTGLTTEAGCRWRFWNQTRLAAYLEAFGMSLRFLDRTPPLPDTDLAGFLFSPGLASELEAEAMHSISQCPPP